MAKDISNLLPGIYINTPGYSLKCHDYVVFLSQKPQPLQVGCDLEWVRGEMLL